MKLGAALALRADLQTKLAQYPGIINQLSIVPEDELDAIEFGDEEKDPCQNIALMLATAKDLEELVVAINLTNAATKITADGETMTITQAIARRDHLRNMVNQLRAFTTPSNLNQFRYARAEIKYVSAIDTSWVRAHYEEYSRRLRDLDIVLQETNWTTELT
jgi:hypothetical protein